MAPTAKQTEKWFVIHCLSDDSHVLVADDAVICEESVRVEEKVKFHYPGFKELLIGIVKGISEDYEKVKHLQDKLNKTSKPKRDGSFHAERPRNAALKCREKVFKHTGSKSESKNQKSNVNQKPESKKNQTAPFLSKSTSAKTKKIGNKTKEVSVLAKVLDDVEDRGKIYSSSSDNNDDSSSDGENGKGSDNTQAGTSNFGYDEASVGNTSPVLVTDKEDDSDDSMTSELSEAEKKVLEKIMKKRKAADFKSLMSIAGKKKAKLSKDVNSVSTLDGSNDITSAPTKGVDAEPTPPINANPDLPLKSSGQPSNMRPRKDSVMSNADKGKAEGAGDKAKVLQLASQLKGPLDCLDVTTSHYNAEPSTSTNLDHSTCSSGMNNRRSRVKVSNYPSKVFKGEFFRVRKDDDKAVKLSPDYEVFITTRDLKEAKRANSASALVRVLVKKVFTTEALNECSVSGKPSSKSGTLEVRPKLNPDGVEAILDFASKRSSKKSWPEPNPTFLKQQMGNVLCDDRMKNRLKEEAKERAHVQQPDPNLDLNDSDSATADGGGE